MCAVTPARYYYQKQRLNLNDSALNECAALRVGTGGRRQEAGGDVRRETATAEEGGISCDIIMCAHACTRRVLDDFWSVSDQRNDNFHREMCLENISFTLEILSRPPTMVGKNEGRKPI